MSILPEPPTITVTSPLDSERTSDNELHTHRRFFIGPMPEKFVSEAEFKVQKGGKRGWFHAEDGNHEDDSDSMSQIIKDHALTFFLKRGGNLEDWGEREERDITDEMLRLWKESVWGSLHLGKRKVTRNPGRWVGGSFEVGNLLGVNILNNSLPVSVRDRASSRKAPTSSTSQEFYSMNTTAGSPIKELPAKGPSATQIQLNVDPTLNLVAPPDTESPSSSTALLGESSAARGGPSPKKPRSEVLLRPRYKSGGSERAKSDGIMSSHNSASPNAKTGKALVVHYADSAKAASEDEASPAPPSEVLERSGSAIEDTSASAMVHASDSGDSKQWGDVILRDRMLVRVSYMKSDFVGSSFDEVQNRTTSNLQFEDWEEFMVVWRQDQIELYEDYNMKFREWFSGHKSLAFIVPLNSSRTKLSLYSFVDLTFCLTCPPTPVRSGTSKSRWSFHRAKEGTNIFIFKVKSRSRATDWMWHLWRQLGGEIPPSIEIRSPSVDVKVKLDLKGPSAIGSSGDDRLLHRDTVIELSSDALRSVSAWGEVVEQQLSRGKTLELAWCMDTNLDWIWQEEDIEGKPRDWAVLSGLALKQGNKRAHLEIRLADHSPGTIHLQDGTRLEEPPAVEGFLHRIKPNTQTRQQIYIASHNGNLFSLSPANAHPPSPPGLQPISGDLSDYSSTLRRNEVRRGVMQVMNAIGVSDLRSVLAVRRAFQITPQHIHDEGGRGARGANAYGETSDEQEGNESDDDDEGGEAGLAKVTGKSELRMKRSFEMLLNNGHIARFETYSRRVAVEWIERLRALIKYWTERHRIDAREEMELAQGRRPRVTPHMHLYRDEGDLPPEPPVDPSAPLPALGSLFSWCVMDGCKPITKGGKVFTRRGLRGQYQLVQLFLVSGQLVQYRVTPKSSLNRLQSKGINLMDAYVCSGYFAAISLLDGEYNPNAAPVSRRYADGLEAEDPEEDMLFVVWYRPNAPVAGPMKENKSTKQNAPIPSLSAKRKLVVFRTRSKLERDAWCWALNCEIEKITRQSKEREEKLRQTGGLIDS